MVERVENHSQGAVKEAFRPLTLIELLRWRARSQPSQTAYTFLKDGDVEACSLTYEELDKQARAGAALLREIGAKGERALLLYPPGLEFIAAFFGCLYAGMIAVPAYPPDTSRFSRSLPRLQGMVADAQATIALTTKAILSRVESMLDQSPLLQSLNWVSGDNLELSVDCEWPQSSINGDALALLQYTSGSTGTPKGVMLSHSNLLHNANLVYHGVEHTPNDCYVSWLPIFHDMGFMAGILQPLYAGIPVVSMSPVTFLQRPLLWLKAITRYRATTSGGPNFAYDLCVRKIAPEQREGLDLSSWTVAFNGAEPIRHETLDRFTEAFAPCGFRRQAFYPCYGLAEATLIVSGGSKTEPPVVSTFQARELRGHLALETDEERDQGRVLVGCGKTLLEQKIVIVNPESLTECPPNEVGEIWVSGGSVAQGYWNSEEETARTFRAYLSDTGEGPFLRTGDLGFLSDGELHVTGRLKDLIIIRGLNHYPQDIELSAERSHPALRRGCGAAFSVEIDGDERLVIVQELEYRQRPDIKAVIGGIREAVAQQHEIHPYAIVLIKPGRIPKTTSGKIQRRATRRAFLAGDLEIIGEWRDQTANSTYGAFQGRIASIEGVEAVATLLASEIALRLGRDPAGVDLNQPIARYGIDSLGAVELMHLIETRFGVILPVSSLLQSSGIAELSFSIAERRSATPAEPALLPAPREERLSAHPLSLGQKALWFLRQLAPESPAYNISSAARVQHALDPAALLRAFQTIVERHPSLRTRFTSSDGQPVQEISESGEISFDEIDASAMSPEELGERLIVEANRPFDLENGPLLRVNLYRRATDEYVLLLSVHHIAVDFWSLAIIMKELGVLYTAERIGVKVTLPSPAMRYTDYVRRQSEMLASPEGERLRNYWLMELTGALFALDLPTDRPRPKIQTYRGGSFGFKLDSNLTNRLKEIGLASGATLYMTLLAAFQVLLHRYTHQERFVVGSPAAGRSRADLAGLIGYVVNLLVLRADLSGNPAFNEYLKRAREVVLGAFDHQEYPFPLLVEQIQPEREASRSPIAQVVFAWQKAQAPAVGGAASFALGENGARLTLGELQLESFALSERVVQFDLTMMMSEENDSLAGSLQFNSDLFDRETIERCARHFQSLVESIARNPQGRVSDLDLISEVELEQLLVEWNDTAYEEAGGSFAHRLFELQAARTPDAVAVADGKHQVSYRELNGRANQIARYLRRRGVGIESPVAVCLKRSAQMITGLLGILKAGCAYLPLDPAYPRERLSFMVRDAAASALLTERILAGDFAEFESHVVRLDSDWEEIAQESNANPDVEAIASEHLAYVIYTSGSTGEPKGVEVRHAGLSNLVTWHQRAYGLTAGDRATQLAGTAFDAAVWELWPYLAAGASIHLPDDETRASASKLIEWLAAEAITVCFLPTPLAEMLIEEPLPPDLGLRAILTGGDALHHGPRNALPFAFVNHYGPTENTVIATRADVSHATDAPPPIGRPIDNTQVYLLDANLHPVPIGVDGELHIGGVGLARGYCRRPELSAEKFIPNPFRREAGGRLYRTGDLARYLPDGQIEFLGRVDRQVKVHGFRVELGEVEAALRQHEDVREAIVVVEEILPGTRRLVAYVIPVKWPVEGRSPIVFSLQGFLRRKLPEYMTPAAFVLLRELPLTPNGKIDYRALPSPKDHMALNSGSERERTPVEDLVSGIFAQVIGADQVGLHDDFFALGGHSLTATQVISRVRQTFQVELPLQSLFAFPTVAGFAEQVESARRDGHRSPATPIPIVSRDGELPPSFAQQRLWFLDQLDPGNSLYNIPAAVSLRGPLDQRALERSLTEILRRHESLRASFPSSQGQPVQVISAPQPFALGASDLRHLSAEEKLARGAAVMAEESELPFDLARGPLARARLLRLEEEEHLLTLTMSHIVADGWSIVILVKELSALYDAFKRGDASPLAEPVLQYADYAVWQRAWLADEILDQQVEYWKRQLKDAPATLDLPTDRPRPAVQGFGGAAESRVLPRELWEGVKVLSRREGVTPFMTLLGAFQVQLSRYSGQLDIAVGTPIAGRTRVEVEGLIGLFVNTLVLRIDLSGDPSFRQLLSRVREVVLSGHAHQDAPFEKLVEALRVERDLSRSPLFEVMFTFQNAGEYPEKLGDLEMRQVKGETRRAKFDLTLRLEQSGEGLVASMEYKTDLFEAGTIRRLLGHYEQLLSGAVRESEVSIRRLPLLREDERRQLLIDFNNTSRDYHAEVRLPELFERQVGRKPEAVALVYEEEHLSYGELNGRANQLAHHLRRLGVGPDARVAICMERSVGMVVALLGALKAGGAYAPLDPAYPSERLASMLEDSAPTVLLTHDAALAATAGRSPELPIVNLESDAWQWAGQSKRNPDRAGADARNLAYVIYTSGSTGTPKGVMNEHRGVVNRLMGMQQDYGLGERDAVLQKTPFSFDVSVWEFFWPLLTGARLVVALPGEHKNPSYLARTIQQQNVTTMHFVPSMLQFFLEDEDAGGSRSLARVICSGEALSAALARRFSERLPNTELHNLYGPTEAAIDVTAWNCRQGASGIGVPIGRPVANTRIYILDASQEPAPIGVAAELHIGGAQVGRGYFNRPELTAERFLPDPFSREPGARVYKTGDLSRWAPGGEIEFLGRNDFQVKIRGFRVELGEIEATLMEAREVREAVVVVKERGSGEKELVCYYSTEEGAEVSGARLKEFLRRRAPEAMIPRRMVRVEEVAKLPNGKVDRKRLMEMKGGEESEERKERMWPRTELEERVAGIWREALEVESVGVDENFFELGGHSLLAVQVIFLLRERLGVDLPLRSLFEFPTVAGLSEEIGKAGNKTMSTIKALAREKYRVKLPSRQAPLLPQETRKELDA